ncbi:hypothetical protein GOBAR_DD00141 [Gossypium barbadense]|nr:hypothetical protein GOBAR_DD00141 [Gossypium barbadense]
MVDENDDGVEMRKKRGDGGVGWPRGGECLRLKKGGTVVHEKVETDERRKSKRELSVAWVEQGRVHDSTLFMVERWLC